MKRKNALTQRSYWQPNSEGSRITNAAAAAAAASSINEMGIHIVTKFMMRLNDMQ